MSEVAATAAVIARVRAEESLLPASERLFEDPFARLFTGGATAAEIDARFRQVPFFREQVRARTRFIDDEVRAALAGGVRQILLLGAGFDCRALRMPELLRGTTRVFEADLREQLAEKRAILAAAGHGIQPWNVHLGCDFGAATFERTLATALSETGYDPATRTLTVLEGVANYLDAEVLDRVLAFAADRAPRESRTVFNYGRFRVDPETLPARLAGLGYAAVETWTVAELYRRYTGCGISPGDAGAAEQFCISRATR